MIDPFASSAAASANVPSTGDGGRRMVFRMERSDRMAGSVPVWTRESTAKDAVAANLADAGRGEGSGASSVLAYADSAGKASGSGGSPREFGFFDLLDMVNPLQHIPVVSTIYRSITGDEIQPISQIVGGAVFGGAAGAASGLANVVVEHETGHDIAGNVAALAMGEDVGFSTKSSPSRGLSAEAPVRRLERAERRMAAAAQPGASSLTAADLPGSAVAFADLSSGARRAYEKSGAAEGRAAGTLWKLVASEAGRADEVSRPDAVFKGLVLPDGYGTASESSLPDMPAVVID